MSGEISALLSSAGALHEIFKTIINARDSGISAAVKSDLTERLLESQARLSQVLGTIVEKDALIQSLAQRVRELEADQSERARYQLAKLGAVGDQFAYRLRPAAELVERADDPPHFLCQPCFDAGKKSVLRLDARYARCSLCSCLITLSANTTPRVARSSTPWSGRDW